jgi:hypothetical protein
MKLIYGLGLNLIITAVTAVDYTNDLSYITEQTGKIFDYATYKQQVGTAVNNKDANDSQTNWEDGRLGYLSIFGRVKGQGILLLPFDANTVLNPEQGYIISLRDHGRDLGVLLNDYKRSFEIAATFETLVFNSDPSSSGSMKYSYSTLPTPCIDEADEFNVEQMDYEFKLLAEKGYSTGNQASVAYSIYKAQLLTHDGHRKERVKGVTCPSSQTSIYLIPRKYFIIK